MNLQTLAQKYIEVRQKRMELEHKADDIKNGEEAELKRQILLEMQTAGIKSANVEGVGRVVSKDTKYYEVQDLEAFSRAMFQHMLDAAKQGRPFSDGLLLQKRVHRENSENLLENSEMKLESFGIAQLVRTDLSVTKTK